MQFTAVYWVTGPGGSWNAKDNGNYALVFRPKQVADVSGNYVAPPDKPFPFLVTIPKAKKQSTSKLASALPAEMGPPFSGTVIHLTNSEFASYFLSEDPTDLLIQQNHRSNP